MLKKTSFITASHLDSSASNLKERNVPENQSLHKEETVQTKPSIDLTTKSTNKDYGQDNNQGIEIRSLKRAKDNLLISNAEYTSTYVRILLVDDINLNINTPPFKSFFLNRILEVMKLKDKEKNQKGEIDESEIIDYKVDNDENGKINSVTISNYRERERLNEILNTATWVFTRMLEKGI